MESDVIKSMETDVVKSKTPDQVNTEVPSDEQGVVISEIHERIAETKSLDHVDEGGIFVTLCKHAYLICTDF